MLFAGGREGMQEAYQKEQREKNCSPTFVSSRQEQSGIMSVCIMITRSNLPWLRNRSLSLSVGSSSSEFVPLFSRSWFLVL